MSGGAFSIAQAMQQAHAAYRQGALDACESSCAAVLQREPRHLDALTLTGAVRLARGDAAGALACFTRTTEIDPRQAEGFSNRGVAQQALGRLDEAERSFRRALEILPGHVDALYNLALVHGARGRWDEARAAYRRVVQLAPGHAMAWNNLGNVLQKLRQPEEAVQCHRRALELRPTLAEAWNNLGTALSGLKRFEEALRAYDEALRLRPRHADASLNRSSVLREMGRGDEALAAARAGLEADPSRADGYVHLGLALEELGRFDEALHAYDEAIARPGEAEGRWNKALLLLLRGDYERGWPLYEARWATPELRDRVRHFPFPPWRGEDLAGKALLLHAEQGAGDAIQFARYVPMLEARGARLTLETPTALAPLLASSFPSVRIVAPGASLEPHDFHCALGSLPLAFGTTLASIPGSDGYLRGEEERRREWRERLGGGARRRIGLAWSGNPQHRNDHKRSIPLASLAPFLAIDADFHSLQKDIRASDRAAAEASPRLRVWGDDLADFADTAALIDAMDLVITVDTSVAHLAGALAKPTWLLVPTKPDWRWMLERADSPWYASVRIFRQSAPGEWAPVIEEVRSQLR